MATKTEPEKTKERGMICVDAELVAMQKISRIINKLEDAAKIRVVSWLADKLKFPVVDAAKE